MARLNYVELPVGDIGAAKAFYEAAFGWSLTGFGPTYAATMTGDTDIGLQGDPAEATQGAAAGDRRRRPRGGAGRGRGRGRPDRPPDLRLPRRPPLPLPRSARQRARGGDGGPLSGRSPRRRPAAPEWEQRRCSSPAGAPACAGAAAGSRRSTRLRPGPAGALSGEGPGPSARRRIRVSGLRRNPASPQLQSAASAPRWPVCPTGTDA